MMKDTHGYFMTKQNYVRLFLRTITMSNVECYIPFLEMEYILPFIITVVHM